MLLYNLRHAFRRLLREPAFTLAAVLTLALGVGANVAVFAVVEAVLLRPLPYNDAERLVILNHKDQRTGITKEFIAIGDYVDIAKRQTAFKSIAAYGTMQATIFGPEEPYAVHGLSAAPGLFDLLGLRPVIGRALDANDSQENAAPVAMLGYDLWHNRFGADPAAVGRSIKVGKTVRTIVGIAPKSFRFPANANTEIILPMTIPTAAPAQRRAGWTFAVARLNPTQTVQQGTAHLAAISQQLANEFPQSNQASTYFAVPLRDAMVGNTKSALVLLLAAVGVVLLIACANVANLLMARSLSRRREMAVRTAMGAGRGQLAAMMTAESLVLALTASVGAIAFAYWGAHALVQLVPDSLNVPGLTDVRINGIVLLFAIAVTIAVAVVFALISTFTLRNTNISETLVTAARSTMSARARRAASGVVVAEVAFAIVLLIGAGLIMRTFGSLLAVKPGFSYDNVLAMDVAVPQERYADQAARAALYDRVFTSIRTLPEVVEAGAAAVTPLTGNNWTVPLERPEHPAAAGEQPPEVGWQLASAGYFKALHIPLIAGRLFNEHDKPNGPPVVIVSEAVQKQYFDGQSAVGKSVKLGDQLLEIVGVVGNIRRAELRDEPRADMYFPFEMAAPGATTLFIRTSGDPMHIARSVQTTLRGIEPNTTILETTTLADVASESVRVTKLVLWLLAVFAVMALALAAVGSYAVMSYVVRQRTREIGTRMALGATRGDILMLVLRSGAAIAIAGTVVGLALGLAAARSLRSLLYGVSASDPVTLVIAALVLTATIIVACYLPARRAASVDPARTLGQQ